MQPSAITVLCVDDARDITLMFSHLINGEADMRCVGALQSADELLAEVERLRPDVVLLDLTMPGKDPLTALRELGARVPASRVIVYSGYDDTATVDSTLEAGAWGCVSKHSEPGAVLAAIRRVAAGEAVY